MNSFVDCVCIVASSSGTGAFVLGEAATGFFGAERLTDGASYSYSVQQDSRVEVGVGTFTSATRSLSRTVSSSTNGGAPVDFPAGVLVSFTFLASDIAEIQGSTGIGKANAAALGVAPTANNMGTFSGYTIPDNVSAKAGMQALETALEVASQISTGFFYADDGAKIQRFNDRVFIAGATKNLGTDAGSQPDWLTVFQLSKGHSFGFLQGAQVGILNDDAPYSSNAVVVGAQTKNYTDARNAIGILSIGLNNNSTLGTGAWGGYFEGQRDSSAVGPTYASEFDAINYVNATTPVTQPYSQAGNQIGAIQIASGGESISGVFDVSFAINVRDNGAKFKRGLVFGSNSLAGSDGVTGTAEAISFAKGHGQLWYAASHQVSAIYGTATTADKGATLNLSDDRVTVSNFTSGKWIFRIENIGTSSVNYPGVVPSATGNKVQFAAYGSDANVGIQLTPQGNGALNIPIGNVRSYANDAAAAAGGLLVGDFYRNGSAVMVRAA